MNLSYLKLQSERLVEELQNVTNELRKVQAMLDMLGGAFTHFDELARSAVIAQTPGAYPYIPYDIGSFVELMVDLHHLLAEDPALVDETLAHRPVRFLEVGCGIGRNLLLLKRSGLPFAPVEGIDIAAEYLELGRKFFGFKKELQQHDALKFDYAPYDVVYFYRPFRDDLPEKRLERRIVSQARPGAYLVAPLGLTIKMPASLEPMWDYRIWRKKG